MMWNRNQSLSGRLVYMFQYQSCETRGIKISECENFVCLYTPTKLIILKQNTVEQGSINSSSREPSWNWGIYYEHEFSDKVILIMLCFFLFIFFLFFEEISIGNVHEKRYLSYTKIQNHPKRAKLLWQ